MPSGEKTKLLWQNDEYRQKVVDSHTGKKHPEHSNRMKGNKNAFKNATIFVECHICKKEFSKYKSQNKKYCSLKCANEARREIMLNNKRALGNKLTPKHKAKISKFISETRTRENNPNWKGGTKRYHEIAYGHKKYKKWRTAVFKRDDYTCQECNIRSQKGTPVIIEAHHKKEWCNYPDLRFDINNGITLCRSCHNKTKYGKYTKKI